VAPPAGGLQVPGRIPGAATRIKAGSYEIAPGDTPASVLAMLVRGEQALRQVTLVEGWTFRQVRAALQSAEHLQDDLKGLGNDALMARIGLAGVHPEGRFFPDTYRYPKRSPASAVLRQAAQAMQQQLDAAWAQRAPDTPLKTPTEALILASIVEKETGQASDRGQVAGVFSNRLRIGMRLQTDPSVIYGLGERLDCNLSRRDLDADGQFTTAYDLALIGRAAFANPEIASYLALRTADFPGKKEAAKRVVYAIYNHNRMVRDGFEGALGGKSGFTSGRVRAELMAHAPDGIGPGKQVWVGLQLAHQPEWHTYWKNSGDSGLPTQLQWQLPAGVTAGDIAWPNPKKIPIGPLANYGYEGTVLRPVPLLPAVRS